MARMLIATLAFLSLATTAHAEEEKTALVLFDMPKEVAIEARAKLTAATPLASLERTRALFDPRELNHISPSKIEEVRAAAGLEKLILVDSAVPPRDGFAVYRIRVFFGEEPQLRFQATAGAHEQSARVIADSVMQLLSDWAKGRAASH